MSLSKSIVSGSNASITAVEAMKRVEVLLENLLANINGIESIVDEPVL